MKSLREIARSAALWGAAAEQFATDRERLVFELPRVQFLYFHFLEAVDAVHLERLFARLAEQHEFVPYSEAVRQFCRGDVSRPVISVSCDDGEESNLLAADIFDRVGVSACFFLCPGAIDQKDEATLNEFRVRTGRPEAKYLGWKAVEGLLARGHEVGAHTVDHYRMSRLTQTEAEWQIGESKRVLERHVGPIRHFAFPFGRFCHFGPWQERLVGAEGFESCASAERGCHLPRKTGTHEKSRCIRRDHIAPHWPVAHSLYFVGRSARMALPSNDYFPY